MDNSGYSEFMGFGIIRASYMFAVIKGKYRIYLYKDQK